MLFVRNHRNSSACEGIDPIDQSVVNFNAVLFVVTASF